MKSGKTIILLYLVIMGSILLFTLLGSEAVTVLSENVQLNRRSCIIIDAGHGGIDGGATSCTGVLESELNLQIAHRLNDLLHLMGYDTKMMRYDDVSIYTEGETIAKKKISDLRERVRICNETERGLLLSIHQNTFQDEQYWGAQVFYAKDKHSEAFAKALQNEITQSINPGSKRLAKQAKGIYLMEHINCPGILIECGFLSNIAEEAKLRSEEYQKKLCCVIAFTASRFILDWQTND